MEPTSVCGGDDKILLPIFFQAPASLLEDGDQNLLHGSTEC